jgi:D-alanyl-D-alanine dipeptidase
MTGRHASGGITGRLRRTWTLAAFVLLAAVAAAQPPQPAPGSRPPELVELTRLDTTIRLDIRYATPNNFMKRAMYAQARAFLQRPAAEALVRAGRALRAKGFGLLVFDGYRPWSVTKKFWDETPSSQHAFVADPKQGSKHNRGCAVDLSLYSLRTGHEIVMPSRYDDFTPKASPRYRGGSRTERRMRDLLRAAMEHEGFTVDGGEWWHFDYKDWHAYDVLDIPFEQLDMKP